MEKNGRRSAENTGFYPWCQCFRSGFIDFGSVGWIPIRIRIQSFDDQKLEKNLQLKKMWYQKFQYLSLGLHKGGKLQEKPSALKREHSALQNIKFVNFFLFWWVIFALLDSESRSTGSNTDPDHCLMQMHPEHSSHWLQTFCLPIKRYGN